MSNVILVILVCHRTYSRVFNAAHLPVNKPQNNKKQTKKTVLFPKTHENKKKANVAFIKINNWHIMWDSRVSYCKKTILTDPSKHNTIEK